MKSSIIISFCEQSSIHVEVKFVCDAFSKIVFPNSFANNRNLFNHISDIAFYKSESINQSQKAKHIFETGDTLSRLTFRYDVHLNEDSISYNTFYAPFKKGGFTHLIGAAIFAMPETANENTCFTINIDSLPIDWHVYATCAPPFRHSSHFTIKGVTNLKESLLFITKKEPIILFDTTAPVFLFKDDNLKSNMLVDKLVAQCVSSLRKHWNNTDKFYLINISTFDSLDQGVYYRATCFKNGITVGLSEHFDYQSILAERILIHELTHNWIGIKLKPEDENKYVWFTEGFTEYITWEVLNKENRISEEEYVNHYNEVLRRISLSDFRNTPYQKVQNDFWNFSDAKEIPYIKGSLLALQLNHMIRSENSERTLWDVLKFLLQQRKPDEEKKLVSDLILSNAFDRFCKTCQFADFKEQYIDRGNDVQLSGKVFGEGYDLDRIPIGQFELGFDWDKSTGQITYVKRESQAYDAGIRKGATLLSHSIFFDHPDVPVEIKMKHGKSIKSISFLPQKKEKVWVPQFVRK